MSKVSHIRYNGLYYQDISLRRMKAVVLWGIYVSFPLDILHIAAPESVLRPLLLCHWIGGGVYMEETFQTHSRMGHCHLGSAFFPAESLHIFPLLAMLLCSHETSCSNSCSCLQLPGSKEPFSPAFPPLCPSRTRKPCSPDLAA